MSSTKDQIIKALEAITEAKEINLEFPENEAFGDYSSNIALVSKNLKVEEIVEKINEMDLPAKAETKAGFINFWLKKDVLVDNLIEIDSEKEKYGKDDLLKGKKYLIEHTSPNPNKALHLGHLRNNVTAMAISNIWEFLGCDVVRDCIDNNRGIAIAKLMWGYLKFAGKNGEANLDYWFDHQDEWQKPEDLGLTPDRFVDELYVKASKDFEGAEVEKKVRQMVVDWEKEEPKTWALWKKVLGYSYQGQERTLKRLGNKWDKVWHEDEHYKKGKEMVKEGLKIGVFKRGKEGAIITDLKRYKIPDTVVIKSDGTALYITQDLALTKLKMDTFHPDRLFWVIGPEQSLALKQMYAVCEQLGIGKLQNFIHLAYGYMSIKGQGKMSSRAGNVVFIDELIDLAKIKIKKIMDGSSFSESEIEKISEMVGLGAVKYSILKVGRLQDIAFDVNESVSLEGNSGPYLQYTVARINSVLAKSTNLQISKSANKSQINDEELRILRTLVRFPEIIESAAFNYSPNTLCNYLYNLAQKFNSFYNKYRILPADTTSEVKSADTSEVYVFRIALTSGVGQVLKTGLKLLGISIPERM